MPHSKATEGLGRRWLFCIPGGAGQGWIVANGYDGGFVCSLPIACSFDMVSMPSRLTPLVSLRRRLTWGLGLAALVPGLSFACLYL